MAYLDKTGLTRVLSKLAEKFSAEASARNNADASLAQQIDEVGWVLLWQNTEGTVEPYTNVSSI